MEITRPDYYKEFSCIAGACPDTCCAGWQIVIDDKSLKKYKRVKGTFRNRLHNDIDWKEKVFRQYEKRCAFLNEDSLCDIYSEVGKRMLCDNSFFNSTVCNGCYKCSRTTGITIYSLIGSQKSGL